MTRLVKWLLSATFLYGALCLSLTLGSAVLSPDCSAIRRTYDVAVVLGGGNDMDSRVRALKLGRIDSGVELYQRGKAARLHLSGGGADPDQSTAVTMSRIAREQGVPQENITLETRSRSTLENALFSSAQLSPDASLLIVTEGYHAWRSWLSFAWAGRQGDVCASPSPRRTTGQKFATLTRETASWGLNVLRAGLWSIAGTIGLADRMPRAFLS